ncbi:hypothetical protein F5878DRAFT_666502 [Lentinula raphanica]|uniref:DUF4100 domain-containing protein n=1 Tax=Lentinula raphanica TaxID=153919 RepID=A0AA38UB86_9AGAR|nr:hypothetical protein F5878DRAFT_666502 [Lentinula raphanica]
MSDPSATLSASTTMSDISQRPAIIMPMPVPGMPDAPRFEGKDTREFLEQIEAHGLRAGITDSNRLVDYIIRYSSRAIKEDIRFMPEFDAEVEGKTWDAACKMLLQMFSAHEEPPEVTIRDLEDSCILWSNEEPILKRSDVDKYQRKFFSIAAPLLKQKMLTSEMKGYYFLQGLPKKDQKYVEKKLPAENKKKTNPPTVEAIIKLIHEKIDNKDSILHHNWDSEEEDLDEVRQRLRTRLRRREEDNEEEQEGRGKKGMDKSKVKKVRIVEEEANDPEWKGKAAMDEITGSDGRNNSPNGRTIAIDGENGVRLDAGRGKGNFLQRWEMPNLVRENLVVYDYIARKYTLPNGQDLPCIPYGVSGGVAGMLRGNAATTNPTNGQERNGHIVSSSPASISYGSVNVFGNDVFGVASLDRGGMEEVLEGQAYPSLRSGRDTARFNPASQQGRENRRRVDRDPNNYNKPGYRPPGARGIMPPEPTIHTEESGKTVEREKAAKIDIPVPPNPINRPEGWKKSQPSTSKGKEREEKDVEMRDTKDAGGKPNPGTSFHYTSDLQKKADRKKVLDKVLDTEITLSLADLVGCSPALQKLISEVARTRREYGKEMVSAIISQYKDEGGDAIVDDGYEYEEGLVSPGLCVAEEDRPRLQNFLHTYSSAVTQSSTKYYAMVTGVFVVTIGGRQFRAMIDTGSELNVGAEDIPEKTGMPMDLEGMKWGLKGIHGEPEQLRGVIVDLPMKIGKYEFPHHLFVSRHQLNPNWDIILGQPFLQWYACRIDYWRAGHMQLLLWNDGDKDRNPHLTLALTDPEDRRNQQSIGRTRTPKGKEASSNGRYEEAKGASSHDRYEEERMFGYEDF